ncbi:MAG: nucleotide exchange factor GrpE [Haloferacaceae archaeon]
MSDDAAEGEASDADGGSAAAGVEPTADDDATAAHTADEADTTDERSTGSAAGAGADADAEADADRDLVARVAAHDEALADEVRALRDERDASRDRVAELEARVEDLEAKLKRKAADFENYKKRAERRREELKERATEDLVERVVGVRDDLVRALDQDEDADIRDGIESTLATFDRVLGDENVDPIEPDPGDEVDPHRHEVMMRVESDRPEGRIVDLFRPGYLMAGRVIQTAQVTVSEGGADADGSEGADADAANDGE